MTVAVVIEVLFVVVAVEVAVLVVAMAVADAVVIVVVVVVADVVEAEVVVVVVVVEMAAVQRWNEFDDEKFEPVLIPISVPVMRKIFTQSIESNFEEKTANKKKTTTTTVCASFNVCFFTAFSDERDLITIEWERERETCTGNK